MRIYLMISLIFFPIVSFSSEPKSLLAEPAIMKVSEAVCSNRYVKKERIACMKLVDLSIVKAYWVGQMKNTCNSRFDASKPGCGNIKRLVKALDRMGGQYLEE
ncbi:Uncharacterised protein [Yersinia frederiksenii]|uniref:Uncharacterized protein n=2 Tax=Yersinia frederiksenii TaxID=29484 RepID=A0A380Q1Q6_YERFR|nr:hypothetical protein [Yersinia frederiksenii]ATM96305.1 hypothetical protein CRN75_13615 [Yersinia frederiksenii]KGA48388.1 hypothetical protein DJ58_3740 [Yersinia frederiksenii ATCC 33641]MDN0118882.1 hypothetical protein [Yersinia frederiksenii]CFQ86977.1 Uncharacterised protein [Yersinia frederiksenii]CNF12318.1 Uncharacterised protein [Yersinia frederiksenii]